MPHLGLQVAVADIVGIFVHGITDVIDRKVRALDCIATQHYGGQYARKRSEMEDGSYGNRAGVAYAEQFQRFQPMVRHTLPVTDAELARSTESPAQHMGRRSELIGCLLPLDSPVDEPARYRVPREHYQD